MHFPNPGRPEHWGPARAPSQEVPFQTRKFWAKNGQFLPKAALKPTPNGQTKSNRWHIPRAYAFLVSKSPLVASKSRICPRNGPKCAQSGFQEPQTKNGPYRGLCGRIRFQEHLIPQQPLHFVWQPPHFVWQPPHLVWQPPHLVWQPPHSVWQPPHLVWRPPHSVWFPPLKIAQMDAWTPAPGRARTCRGSA